jgi:hypothetical protein
MEAPVTLLSTSPERDDRFLMKDPFEGQFVARERIP